MRRVAGLAAIGLAAVLPTASLGLDDLAARGVECVAFAAATEKAADHYNAPEDPIIVERDRKMFADLTAATRGTASDDDLAAEKARLVEEMTPAVYAFHLKMPKVPGTGEDPIDFMRQQYDRCDILLKQFGLGRP